jgi:hypothetical protein
MRDARLISAREVSHGVQRLVSDWTTWFGSRIVAHIGAGPLIFERLSASFIQRLWTKSVPVFDNVSALRDNLRWQHRGSAITWFAGRVSVKACD